MHQQVKAPSYTQDVDTLNHPYDEHLDAVRDRIAKLILDTKGLVSPEKAYQLKRREVHHVYKRDYALNEEKHGDSVEGLKNRAHIIHEQEEKLRQLDNNYMRSARAATLAFEDKVDWELKNFAKDVWELVWSAPRPHDTPSSRFRRDSIGIAAETSADTTPPQGSSPVVGRYSTDLAATDDEGDGNDDRKRSLIVKLPFPKSLDPASAAKLISTTPATQASLSLSGGLGNASAPVKRNRCIDFEDVYQGGLAEIKYRIVPDKRYPGKWFIFRCDKHKMNFIDKPQNSAATHMRGSGHNCTISRDWFFEFGVQVRNCDAALAKLNNDAIPERSKRDRKVPIGKDSSLRRRRGSSMSTDHDPDTDCDDMSLDERPFKYARHRSRGRMRALSDVNPVPGRVFNVYWSKLKKWYAAVVLPKGSFSEIGLPGSMEDTPLLDCLPLCYEKDGTSWKCKAGYNDGEPRAPAKMYPIMYFDVSYPDDCNYAWLSIKDLEPFDPRKIERKYRATVLCYVKGRERQAENELHDSDAESSGKRSRTTASVLKVQWPNVHAESSASNSRAPIVIDLTADTDEVAIKYEQHKHRYSKTWSNDEDIPTDTSSSGESATDSDGNDEVATFSETKVPLHRDTTFDLNSKPINAEESSLRSKQNVSQGHGEPQAPGELIVVQQASIASIVNKSADQQREAALSVSLPEKIKKSDSPRVAKHTPGPFSKRARKKWSIGSVRKPA
jgi:hypothetical protein